MSTERTLAEPVPIQASSRWPTSNYTYITDDESAATIQQSMGFRTVLAASSESDCDASIRVSAISSISCYAAVSESNPISTIANAGNGTNRTDGSNDAASAVHAIAIAVRIVHNTSSSVNNNRSADTASRWTACEYSDSRYTRRRYAESEPQSARDAR
jgi:hypothetical protein